VRVVFHAPVIFPCSNDLIKSQILWCCAESSVAR
jgi:hypothetical protein